MNVSALNSHDNVPKVGFGNKYKETKNHWISGGVIGAAAGLATGKFLPALKPDINNTDSFNSSYETLKSKADDTNKKFIDEIKRIHDTRPQKISRILEKLGIEKSAETISASDFLDRNIDPGARSYEISRLKDPEKIADNSKITVGEKIKWVENEEKYIQGVRDGFITGQNKELGAYRNIQEAIEKETEKLTQKKLVHKIAASADNSGNIAKKDFMKPINKYVDVLLKDEIRVNEQRILKMIDGLNLKKIKVMGAIGLVAGAVIGGLIKTQIPEGRK